MKLYTVEVNHHWDKRCGRCTYPKASLVVQAKNAHTAARIALDVISETFPHKLHTRICVGSSTLDVYKMCLPGDEYEVDLSSEREGYVTVMEGCTRFRHNGAGHLCRVSL